MLGGDFNVVLSTDEKAVCVSHDLYGTGKFSDFIRETGTIDAGYKNLNSPRLRRSMASTKNR